MQTTISVPVFERPPVCHVARLGASSRVTLRIGDLTLELPGADRDALESVNALIEACVVAARDLRTDLRLRGALAPRG